MVLKRSFQVSRLRLQLKFRSVSVVAIVYPPLVRSLFQKFDLVNGVRPTRNRLMVLVIFPYFVAVVVVVRSRVVDVSVRGAGDLKLYVGYYWRGEI